MASWAEELNLAYYVDWKEKLVALRELKHSSCSAAGVCEIWEHVPKIDCGQLLRYLYYGMADHGSNVRAIVDVL